MPGKGKFYVFEGIDGSGKSSVARTVHNFLSIKYIESVLTEEPYKYGIGGLIRDMIMAQDAETSELTDLLAYALDRSLHVRNLIEPALKEGKVVISDRYYHSFIYNLKSGDAKYLERAKIINSFFPKPDITFVLDADAETVMKRFGSRNVRYKYEILPRMRELAANYRTLDLYFPGERIEMIDADLPEEEVKQQVINIVIEDLGL